MSKSAIKISDLKPICRSILTERGVKKSDAELVIDELVQNDLDGYSSHGLIRLIDYVSEIDKRVIDVNASPSTMFVTSNSAIIDGNRGLGIKSSLAIIDAILSILQKDSMAIVGLKNSNHIGRLAYIGKPICTKGYAIIGFVNYLGAGQKVPAYGGKEGRFCTNPILLGVPSKDFPLILDMTSSSVSEGKIRTYAIDNQKVPSGLLIDENWNTVNDPTKLYDNPNSVFIKPLGGEVSYKGFGLALLTEIFAGILTGAGFVSSQSSTGGNGGFFIAFDMEILGVDKNTNLTNIENLIQYIKSSPTAHGFDEVRIPNEPKTHLYEDKLKISTKLWAEILNLQI